MSPPRNDDGAAGHHPVGPAHSIAATTCEPSQRGHDTAAAAPMGLSTSGDLETDAWPRL
ncbi:hypothetical protein [Pseudonocardia sp. ICBG601]|uniref:hypothetical protein n=1 Tax=Pseudonocardia sp. ICBG601 TaxID=2846759 RepID=UPI001CF6C0BB|nr:hypothetical protein [Pseudonocardia sp. ICBG601]